ncbi:hypothetical protein [Chondromyces apiculatus]|uniref:Carboxypeptidase regulatory-like domain-containing protein n=1 Tax=Chondromyces apiculatus DSM 436 TaxID=1192034 RepID=A0A017T6J8_9BACT|nr:hypothetical protein [Chondromyces apiculatus]EYF04854.1 Hypothetical protein CAP_3880 [Chondromyces apiculatus DSM 436]
MTLHRSSSWFLIASILAYAFAACGGDEDGNEAPERCSVLDQTGCAAGLACEEVEGGGPGCFAPVTLKGRVLDALEMAGLAGARVIARDANEAALSRVAVSGADGAYTLQVAARRDRDGKPVAASVTLRADASGYETFPRAPRVALPLDLATATGDPPRIETVATDIALLGLPDVAGLGTVSGAVVAERPGGTLVVAGGVTGAADVDGAFTVFNVPAGDHEVRGYAGGLQLAPAAATVRAGEETGGVLLNSLGAATAVVRGKVSIVNAPGGSETSVILVVKDTFVEATKRGEAPRGLRAGGVSGEFAIEGVPDGTYKVLAAFENDDLVRDPDTSIGGTEILEITIAGADHAVDATFKVTEALAVLSPGAEGLEEVSGTPELAWADDSSEGGYTVQVFDVFGDLVWEDLDVPEVNGGGEVRVTYGGPPLDAGMIYQFRATSMSKGQNPTPLSQTEDLKGVFVYR